MSINASDSSGIVTESSPYSLRETVERLQQSTSARNLLIFTVIDHSGEAAKIFGLKMEDAKLLIFG